MKEDKKVPQLRFPEFTDAWKQRKFGEFVERKSDSALSSTSIPSVEYENVESETGILKKDIYVKTEFKKGVLFSDKDVLYGKLRPYLHNWLAPSFTGVAVGDWWVLSPKNCSKDFLYRLLQTLTFDEIANQTSGTKMPRADWNLVSSTAFYIPSSIEEQAKIGSLFNRIDSTITLQQRKLNSLQKLKKGLLQKMFPKNGENIPEIRFPEFSDAWKQRKLGEIIDYSNGIGHENYVLPQGKYELVTLKSINSSGKLVCSEKFVNEDFETLKAETLIMMLSEQAKGMLGMTTIIPCDNKYVLNQRVAALKAHNDVEVHFLTNAINNKQNYFEQMGAGTKVQNITRGHVEECVIELPSLEEQKKIGSLFSKLEVTITLQQCKLESLQKLKKGLLQQMFI